ncbi:MAG: hypothetical protein H8E21_08595 [Gammaproteobacteria bacterium]|nr:hypothetical protein [Gammaproteobacteria bacterium]
MKLPHFFTFLCLAAVLNSAYATDASPNDDEYRSFCAEQAQMAGIEDPDEKKQYIASCLINYGVHSAD